MINTANQNIDAWAADLAYVYNILKTDEKVLSEGNTIYDAINDVQINGKNAAERFVYNPEGKDPGIYTQDAATGELVRLSSYKAPIEVWTEGIDTAGDALNLIATNAKKGKKWDGVLERNYK